MRTFYTSKFNTYLESKDFSKGTLSSAEKNLTTFFIWVKENNLDPVSITYEDLMSYLNFCDERSNKETSVNVHLRYVRYYMDYLMSIGERTDNPAIHLHKRGARRTIPFNLFSREELEEYYEDFPTNSLVEKRNKVIVGLLVFQGITTSEINRLDLTGINIRKGTITIPGSSKSNSRTLTLESCQMSCLSDYLNKVRAELMELQPEKRETDKLFVNSGKNESLHHAFKYLLIRLKRVVPKLKNLHQFRSSVIALWIEQHGERMAQYMAGFKYVSSIERYKQTDVKELQQEIDLLHPLNDL